MGDGTERRCDLCGKVIPVERLQALPETNRCVECARKKGSDVLGKRAEVGMDVETYKDLLSAMRS